MTFEKASSLASGARVMVQIAASKIRDGGFPKTAARLCAIAEEFTGLREILLAEYDPLAAPSGSKERTGE